MSRATLRVHPAIPATPQSGLRPISTLRSLSTPPPLSTVRPLTVVLVLTALTALLASTDRLGAQQAIDEEYTAQIREFTTEDFFSTPHVDHLPASETVPTPLDVLGHIAGAADVLSYPEEIYTYMRAVADASPRVQVHTIGRTEEGREIILVLVSSEENLRNIELHKANTARLGDPRITTEAEAASLISSTVPMYWATGAIHSPETGSPEMLMELVYRLAVEDTEFVRTIRDNLIFMTTPVIEVDGRAKVVDLHMGARKDPDLNLPTRPLYWGKYVAHDNNRDGMGLALALSQAVVKTFLEYRPVVFHDLHESASHLYTSTGRGPYNAWLDPIVINEWNRLAYKEVEEMTALGVPGVYTHDFYDGWAPNYMMWVAHLHNGMGRFYETQGAGSGATRVIRTEVEREWHRPNTPLPEVLWSIRNNVNLQQSAIMIALNEVANTREEFMSNFWRKSQRSVAKATAEGPAAYVFPADERRPGQQATLLALFQQHGFEIHRADDDFEVGEAEYGEGSFIVRMDQPFSRGADMLLDKQYYNPNDPRPYDDVGWTQGALYDVESVRVEDVAILDVPMTLMQDRIEAPGGVAGDRSPRAYVINYNADNGLASFVFAHPELFIEAAEQGFTVDDRDFNAGSFIIRADGANARSSGSSGGAGSSLRETLADAGRQYGFTAYGVDSPPEVTTHRIETPRIAVMHTWTSTQTEGWLRIGLDQYGIPFEYISVHDVRDQPNLRQDFDVILFGPSSLNALSIIEGLQGDEPVPWRASEVTPNIGRQDSTDDMRGGLGLEGVLNLKAFVESGGVFVTLSSSSSLPTHFGLAQGVSIRSTPDLWARGGVFRAAISDDESPIVYGYGEDLGVYFNTAPVFRVGRESSGRRGQVVEDLGGPGSTTSRRTGRGGADDVDVIQGRRGDLGAAGVAAFEAEEEDSGEEDSPGSGSAVGVRTVMRYAENVEDLLISGGLRNGEVLADSPALVDVTLGEGHVVMFSFNPFWRSETLGSYGLVFNTIMHYRNLSSGEEPPLTDDE
ncbi:MAG: hypothetical protein IIC36_02585 [Gemmatimonadetes bacterium]|nr:hypothetical protein [Gemmatimonadota bacterium]